MTCLGLDLGAGFAKLARCPAGGQARPGAELDVTTVAAAVAYGRHVSEIPAGYSDTPGPGSVRCDGFPLMLGTALSAAPVPAWQGRTAGEVTQSFLRRLLDPGGSLAHHTRPDADPQTPRDADGAAPGGLVVAVPPSGGARHRADDEPSVAGELQDILTALGRPARRVVAAPVAALLWLGRHDPDLAAASRIVVVDIGAGCLQVALCTGARPALRVADSIRLAGGSAWGEQVLSAVGVGDRLPTLAECLVTALATASGAGPARAGQEPVSRWRAFEAALADDQARDRLDAVLQSASAARHRHGSTPALRFGGLAVTASQFLDACEPLARQSAAAVGRLLRHRNDPGWLRFGSGTGTRLVLIGGLSTLYPVRAALLASLGLDPERPGDGVVWPAGGDLLGPAARGAALLAAGLADPGDRYPHALRLAVNRVVRDRLVTEYLELAAPGSIELDLDRTTYLTEGPAAGGRSVLVTVRPAGPNPPGPAPIPVQIVPRGQDPVPVAAEWAGPPEPGEYRVGVRGGPDGPALVLQRADGGPPLAFPLAETAAQPAGEAPGQAAR
ncbi:MAG TPA: hypothetical protein VKU77_05030 [Streptosporangiaceae bacterium]|nr:hypothetical protein [Streptosporangiaceae bacterium]